MTASCQACRRNRPAAELLRVVSVADSRRSFHVCRPSLDEPGAGRCFLTVVGTRDVHRIEAA